LADRYAAIEAAALGMATNRPEHVHRLPIVEVTGGRTTTMTRE